MSVRSDHPAEAAAIGRQSRTHTHPFTSAGRQLPPMLRFDDVLLQRPLSRTSPGVHWPDFDIQHDARHLRSGVPVCQLPPQPASEPARLAGEAVFIGVVDNHFGHIVSETFPRIPQSLLEHPDLPPVFTAARHGRQVRDRLAKTPPPAFKAVMDWVGLPLDRAVFINTPTVCDRLWVAAQAEHVNGPPPSEGYLDLLDRLARQRGCQITPDGAVYVTRAQLRPGLGGHAGEAYLVEALSALGVRVIAPERLPLAEQLASYAGARRLIFAEGSAIHGRQLLGRIDQDIDVIVRRPGRRMALGQLMPRCNLTGYIPATGGAIGFVGEDGRTPQHATVALYDLPVLFDYFGAIGVALDAVWDHEAYCVARDGFVLDWLAAVFATDAGRWQRMRNPPEFILHQIEAAGLGHLHARAAEILARAPLLAEITE